MSNPTAAIRLVGIVVLQRRMRCLHAARSIRRSAAGCRLGPHLYNARNLRYRSKEAYVRQSVAHATAGAADRRRSAAGNCRPVRASAESRDPAAGYRSRRPAVRGGIGARFHRYSGGGADRFQTVRRSTARRQPGESANLPLLEAPSTVHCGTENQVAMRWGHRLQLAAVIVFIAGYAGLSHYSNSVARDGGGLGAAVALAPLLTAGFLLAWRFSHWSVALASAAVAALLLYHYW